MLLLAAAAAAPAAEVVVTLADGRLGARVDALAYPATLQKELTSGLTNRLYARVTLADARAELGRRIVEIAIRYDLWDQRFSVVSALDGANGDSRTLATRAELGTLLGALPLPRLFDAATLPGASV
jgi:hypothetical protein